MERLIGETRYFVEKTYVESFHILDIFAGLTGGFGIGVVESVGFWAEVAEVEC